MVKNLPAMCDTWVRSLGWEDSWRRKWQPTPVFLPGKSHGQRSLLGYRPWGPKESDTTEQLSSSSKNWDVLDWSFRLCEYWSVFIGPVSQRKATQRSQQKTQGIFQDPSSFSGSEGLVLFIWENLFVYLLLLLLFFSLRECLKLFLGF